MKIKFFVVLALLLAFSTVNAQSVVPVVIEGNPRCGDLSPAFNSGLKIEPAVTGTNIVNGIGTISQVVYSNETMLDWTSVPAFIGAVIIKGGPHSNVYYYNPAILGDIGLTTPNGEQISHVEYCFNRQPTAANVVLGGRVFDSAGYPKRSAYVTLTNAEGVGRTALTNPFGYYTFSDVEVGQGYTLDVRAKGETYETRFVMLLDNVSDVDFRPIQ